MQGAVSTKIGSLSGIIKAVSTPTFYGCFERHGLQSLARRSTHSGRHRLTLREPKPVPLSNAFVQEEAKKMGGFPYREEGEQIQSRVVPADVKEFSRQRREYRRQLGQLRKGWKQAWLQREERQRTHRREVFAQASERAADLRTRKDAEKHSRRALHRQTQERNRQASLARRELGVARTAVWHQEVDQRRQKWLDAVEADARGWIDEHEVDGRITGEVFADKYPAHLEGWFAATAQRRIAGELRSRAQEAAEQARELQERMQQAREASQASRGRGRGAGAAGRGSGSLEALAEGGGALGALAGVDEDEVGAAALLGLEQVAGDVDPADEVEDGEGEEEGLRALRLDAMAARREAREAAATAERHSTALREDDDEELDVWDSDDWLEREGAARRTQLVDPVEQVEESYRRLAAAGLQVAELYHQKPGSGPREDRDDRLREYARAYLPGVRAAEAEAAGGEGSRARVEGWLTNARGEVVVDEGEDGHEEGQLMEAYAHGDVRQVARLLTRKRQRMVRDYPGLLAARRSAGEPLEGREDEEVAAEERLRLGYRGADELEGARGEVEDALGLSSLDAGDGDLVDSDDEDFGDLGLGEGGSSGAGGEQTALLDALEEVGEGEGSGKGNRR